MPIDLLIVLWKYFVKNVEMCRVKHRTILLGNFVFVNIAVPYLPGIKKKKIIQILYLLKILKNQ